MLRGNAKYFFEIYIPTCRQAHDALIAVCGAVYYKNRSSFAIATCALFPSEMSICNSFFRWLFGQRGAGFFYLVRRMALVCGASAGLKEMSVCIMGELR